MLIMKQLMSAVNYCHKNGVIHRDIKAENILFSKDDLGSAIKLIDFGISVKFEKNSKFKDKAGTILYIAPEVIKGQYNEQCDVWSCGVLMYLILSGEPPFYSKHRQGIIDKILRGKVNFHKQIWGQVSKNSKNLLKRMLTMDPEERPTAEEVLKHPWFSFEEKLTDIQTKEYLSNLSSFVSENAFAHSMLTFIVTNIAHKDANDDALKLFKELDSDGDGRLTRNELIDGYRKVYPLRLSKEIEDEVDLILAQLDTNNSGSIDFSEYLVAAMRRERVLSHKKLTAAFNAFDKDGDGRISKDEFTGVMQGVAMDDKAWLEFIRECDDDGDGTVSRKEFFDFMDKVFR